MNNSMSPRVFVGMPAIITARQQPYLDQWLGWLKDQALDVVQLERGAYGSDPWRGLTELLSRVDGVALLGFRQLDARAAIWRPATNEEARAPGWWTSPWLHVEAGIAVGLGLPVLAAPDDEVTEGVFSPDAWSGGVFGTALSSPDETRAEWLELVREHRRSRG
jgi:hypothetical protein